MAESARQTNPTLSVFDFDGTLTHHDSFVPFLRFAFGLKRFTYKMLFMIWPSLRCLCRQLTRNELKEKLIQVFLTGCEAQWVEKKAEQYCTLYWQKLLRPKGIIAVAAELSAGATVTICSASPEIMLQPFASKLGIHLIGTRLEVIDGILTGKITGHNCRSDEKVARLELLYGSLTQYHLRAWGDTRGDYELLIAAQDPHWRYFHRRQPRRSPLKQSKK